MRRVAPCGFSSLGCSGGPGWWPWFDDGRVDRVDNGLDDGTAGDPAPDSAGDVLAAIRIPRIVELRAVDGYRNCVLRRAGAQGMARRHGWAGVPGGAGPASPIL